MYSQSDMSSNSKDEPGNKPMEIVTYVTFWYLKKDWLKIVSEFDVSFNFFYKK